MPLRSPSVALARECAGGRAQQEAADGNREKGGIHKMGDKMVARGLTNVPKYRIR
jgi:hypothetical protein